MYGFGCTFVHICVCTLVSVHQSFFQKPEAHPACYICFNLLNMNGQSASRFVLLSINVSDFCSCMYMFVVIFGCVLYAFRTQYITSD